MKVTTRGIVLHHSPYSETSLVVKVYTEESGLCSFIVSGVRTRNSRFKSALFQPLTLVEIVYIRKPGNTLQRITEIQADPVLTGITGDLVKSTISIFLAEVLYRTIREEEPNPALFHFLFNSIQVLDISHGNVTRFHLGFMVQLSRYLGFYPGGNYSDATPYFDLVEGCFRQSQPIHPQYMSKALAAHLDQLMKTGSEVFQADIPSAATRDMLKSLVTWFELHQTHGLTIRSHKVLEEVLA